MDCTLGDVFYKRDSVLPARKSPFKEIDHNLYDGNYVDICDNVYGLYKQVTYSIGKGGSCNIYTHKGDEILSKHFLKICSPYKKFETSIHLDYDSYVTKTLDVKSDATTIEVSTILKYNVHSLTYQYCATTCSTKIPPPVTDTTLNTIVTASPTTSKIPPLITNSTSSTKIPPSIATSSVVTSTSSTKYLPVNTVTKKKTVTVIVKRSSTPISMNDNYQCAGQWAQCGGMGFKGPICCKSGYRCHKINKFFSQCI